MSNYFPKGVAWVGGSFVDISEAKISLLDWGFLRSDATYDVAHVWKNRFFLLEKHIDRFISSSKKLRMPCSFSRKEIKSILAGCVKKAKLENSYVEMIQTRGVSRSFDRDPRNAIPNFMAFAVPFGWILKPENFEEGLDIAITSIQRIPPRSINPAIKNYHWLDLVAGMFESYDRGHQAGLLVDENENILEGPCFNFFCLKDGVLYTPERGVLNGITRWAIIEIAKELNIPVVLKSISREDFKTSTEIFATSTAGGVMPITKVDGKKIKNGKFGKTTRVIYEIYWDKHKDPSWSCSVDDLLF